MNVRPVGFAVIGEALVDVVTSDRGTVEHVGGGPLNIAVGLARLGIPTTLFTSIGDDDRSRVINDYLATAGVTLAGTSARPGPASVAAAHIDAAGAAHYEFDIRWPRFEPAEVGVERGVHVGSVAAFLEPGASDVESVLRNRPAGSLGSFDPNVRPALVGSQGGAADRASELAALADVVKLSDEDAQWLYPGEDFAALRRRFLDGGASLVALTRGAGGCAIATEKTQVDLPARRVSVVDTIGAGDAFMSGLLSAILRTDGDEDTPLRRSGHERLLQLARAALSTAAITVQRAGANPPTLAELEAFMTEDSSQGA